MLERTGPFPELDFNEGNVRPGAGSVRYVFHAFDQVFGHLEHLNRQEWLLVLVGVVIVGFFCLRGFGSRSSY